ncbi:MAG: hypothetical protein J4224_03480 [Candidatus Diapherotrites archaeon]|uniref:Uncharacterized protein n=1 Tax=Candidatus Iainarchaeum sp. TaxID=3101447 RepID=A0A7J4IXJ4_9ARCH|nr:MAG: hypothetical protein QT03_C0001G0189 [archaeon GW2011_AR10]MBS3059456.1 hypothetical protein [Candidatus Diapherotrites archaeon]HIH08517.1 hypothetical protein [Candidatus Diapherotrites archaeon]
MLILKRLKEKAWKSWKKSVERENRKLPKGAVSIHYRVFEGRDFSWKEVEDLRKQFGFTDLYLFHGVAMERNGRAVVVSGPQGIGKSTTLRRLIKNDSIRPLDDGIVLVGKKRAGLFVLESGKYPMRSNSSRASKFFRLGRKSIYTEASPSRLRYAIKQKTTNANIIASAWLGSVFSADRSAESFQPRVVELGKLIFLPHERDPLKPKMVSGQSVSEIGEKELQRRFGKGKLTVVSPIQKNPKKKLLELILGG